MVRLTCLMVKHTISRIEKEENQDVFFVSFFVGLGMYIFGIMTPLSITGKLYSSSGGVLLLSTIFTFILFEYVNYYRRMKS